MEAVTVTTGIYSHQAAYGTFDGVLPMLPRNDHGPFSFHGQTVFFISPTLSLEPIRVGFRNTPLNLTQQHL